MVHLCIFVMDFVTKIKKAQLYELFDDRGDRIRTCGLLVPNQAL